MDTTKVVNRGSWLKYSVCIYLIFMASALCAQDSLMSRQQSTNTGINKKRLRNVILSQSALYAAQLSFLQFIWYKDHKTTPFHWYNDNDGWLQIDKAGHAYTAYFETAKSYDALRWAGVSNHKAAWYGGFTGFMLQSQLEIYDAFYEGYGFSVGDVAANAVGALLFTVQQITVQDQPIKMKFSYSPSGYPKHHPYYLGETQLQSFFMDYNAHTYWLSLPLPRVGKKRLLPRWLNLAVGYSANGMLEEFYNPATFRGRQLPNLERYSQYLFSLDIDFSKIKTRHKFLRRVFNFLNWFKFPLPTLELNRVQGSKFHWLYF
jgi:hypothetical protein